MAYFNEDNVTEQMCIEIAKQAGYEYCNADDLREAKSDIIIVVRANRGVGSSQKGFWLELNGVLARAKFRGDF